MIDYDFTHGNVLRGVTMIEDKWLSVNDIAEYLGIRIETMYRWLKDSDKKMPGHKVGRHWKFKKREIDKWVKSGGADNLNE